MRQLQKLIEIFHNSIHSEKRKSLAGGRKRQREAPHTFGPFVHYTTEKNLWIYVDFMHEECLMFEGFYVSIYRAVICSCIGKLLPESVFPAFVERKNALRCNFYTIRGKWKLHDVKISIPNDLFASGVGSFVGEKKNKKIVGVCIVTAFVLKNVEMSKKKILKL